MPTISWPRTMTRGEFRGRTFQSGAHYQSAIRKARSKVKSRVKTRVVDTTPRFDFVLNHGPVSVRISGNPTKEADRAAFADWFKNWK